MYAFGLEECNRLDEAEAQARRARSRCSARTRGRIMRWRTASKRAGGCSTASLSCSRSLDTWEDCNSFLYTHNWGTSRAVPDRPRPGRRGAGAVRYAHVGRGARTSPRTRSTPSRCWRGSSCAASMSAIAGPMSRRASKARLHHHFVPFLDLHYLYGLRVPAGRAPSPRCWRGSRTAASGQSGSSASGGPTARAGAHGLAAHARGEHSRSRAPARPGDAPSAADRRQHCPARAVQRDPSRCADLAPAGTMPRSRSCRLDDRERPTVPSTKRALADPPQARPRRTGDDRRLPGRAVGEAVLPGLL